MVSANPNRQKPSHTTTLGAGIAIVALLCTERGSRQQAQRKHRHEAQQGPPDHTGSDRTPAKVYNKHGARTTLRATTLSSGAYSIGDLVDWGPSISIGFNDNIRMILMRIPKLSHCMNPNWGNTRRGSHRRTALTWEQHKTMYGPRPRKPSIHGPDVRATTNTNTIDPFYERHRIDVCRLCRNNLDMLSDVSFEQIFNKTIHLNPQGRKTHTRRRCNAGFGPYNNTTYYTQYIVHLLCLHLYFLDRTGRSRGSGWSGKNDRPDLYPYLE